MSDFEQFISGRKTLFAKPEIAGRIALDNDRPAFNLFPAQGMTKDGVRAVTDWGKPYAYSIYGSDHTTYKNDVSMRNSWALIVNHPQDILSVDLQNAAGKPEGNFIRVKPDVQVHEIELKGVGKVTLEVPGNISNITIGDAIDAHLAFDGKANTAFNMKGSPRSVQLTDRFLGNVGLYSTEFHMSVQDGRLKMYNTQVVGTGEIKRAGKPILDIDASKLQYIYIGSNPSIQITKDTLERSGEMSFKPEAVLEAPKLEAERLGGKMADNASATHAQQVALKTKSGQLDSGIDGAGANTIAHAKQREAIQPTPK